MEEFGPRHPSKRPLLMALIITDGDADDHEKFSDALKRIGEGVYVTLAVIGTFSPLFLFCSTATVSCCCRIRRRA